MFRCGIAAEFPQTFPRSFCNIVCGISTVFPHAHIKNADAEGWIPSGIFLFQGLLVKVLGQVVRPLGCQDHIHDLLITSELFEIVLKLCYEIPCGICSRLL